MTRPAAARFTPKAVIFDCDGVIVDSEPETMVLLKRDFAERGFVITDAQLDDLLGGVMADVADRARALGADLPPDWVDRFYDRLYDHLTQGVALVPGILGVLDALQAARIPFGMGSNGSDRKMQITLGHYPGLAERFGIILSGQTLGKPKPAPDLYLAVAAALGAAPADCVVIEDSPTGARAAIAAGMRCFGYAPHGNAKLAATGAVLFRSMEDLPALLNLTPGAAPRGNMAQVG